MPTTYHAARSGRSCSWTDSPGQPGHDAFRTICEFRVSEHMPRRWLMISYYILILIPLIAGTLLVMRFVPNAHRSTKNQLDPLSRRGLHLKSDTARGHETEAHKAHQSNRDHCRAPATAPFTPKRIQTNPRSVLPIFLQLSRRIRCPAPCHYPSEY